VVPVGQTFIRTCREADCKVGSAFPFYDGVRAFGILEKWSFYVVFGAFWRGVMVGRWLRGYTPGILENWKNGKNTSLFAFFFLAIIPFVKWPPFDQNRLIRISLQETFHETPHVPQNDRSVNGRRQRADA
jgi:hypothetical protein